MTPIALTRRNRPLESVGNQIPIAEHAVRVLELETAVEGGLADGQLMLVHHADHAVGVRHLRDLAAHVAVPVGDFDRVAGRMVGGGETLQDGMEAAVAGVGYHGRAVDRGSLRDQQTGAGPGSAGREHERREQSDNVAYRHSDPLRFGLSVQ